MADKEDVSAAPASDAPDAGGAAAPAERAPLEDRPQIEVVELDALVLLKLVRHCKESLPTFVTGQLLGLDIGRTLEVTSCFPFPSRDDADLAPEDDKDGAEYQVEMMRCLRNVNVDNNTVGWYQSTHLGSHMTESCLEHQFHYQEHIRNCVVLVFDPMQTTVGHLHLRAFRLTDAFMALYREKKFTPDACAPRARVWGGGGGRGCGHSAGVGGAGCPVWACIAGECSPAGRAPRPVARPPGPRG